MNDQANESLKATNESLQKLNGELSASLEKMKFDVEIEASLERVRSRAMTMRKQDESLGICEVLFSELRQFGFTYLRNTLIIINNEDDTSFLNYDYSDYAGSQIARVRYDGHAKTRELVELIKKSDDAFFESVISGTELDEWRNWRKQNGEYDDERMGYIESLYYYFYSIGKGAIGISTFQSISEKELTILKRFRNVFALAYRRYMDLSLAEAQAKESRIELALERVRARTMAMQKSEELSDTAFVLFQQFQELGEDPIQISIGIMNEVERVVEFSVTDWNGGGGQINRVFKGSFDEPSLLRKVVSAWRNKEKSFVADLTGKDLETWISYRNLISDTVIRLEDTNGRRVVSIAFFSKGHLSISTPEPLPKETIQLLERFAGVFEQTYTRFLDLQKAEAQAKEAKIEVSLERVRSKAMGMQSSEDLAATIAIFYHELESLNVTPRRCGVGLIERDTRLSSVSTMNTTSQGNSVEIIGNLKLEGHPVLVGIYDHWLIQKEYHPVLIGNEIKEYYQLLRPQINFPDYPVDIIQYGYFFFFNEGGVYAWTDKELAKDELQIYRRFTSVLSLTYKRYQDLKQAEAQIREAQIESALERVRSRTLAMQKSDELAETAAVIFKQLIGLGIEPNRLYIAILKDESNDIEFWTTDEVGTKVSNRFTGNAYHNPFFQKMYEGWLNKRKTLILDMQGDELSSYFKHLRDLGIPVQLGLSQKRRLQYLAYFANGFLGMASPDEQPEATINLLERFASVFNLTYTRFNDLQISEAHARQAEADLLLLQTEKKRAEDALVELRETQKLLIQSEKMASLGELTAGIAHEIQNPLNFVNNFSEVSAELISEMHAGIDKGDMREVIALADDLKNNLEKITHHGKRADAIVKSMLQHSRVSSGIMESTNINALADEYLRLAYHGIRAKDYSFNATLKTNYDESIGHVSIIPQDMGRVILNLINNAFYAVEEKKKQTGDGYEPTVSISTKKLNGDVAIQVKDNGNGIPPKVLEKIFQPFFTTKPTGQGTGLGLSLSYDIVKAHGGTLTAESMDGEGACFTILLKIN